MKIKDFENFIINLYGTCMLYYTKATIPNTLNTVIQLYLFLKDEKQTLCTFVLFFFFSYSSSLLLLLLMLFLQICIIHAIWYVMSLNCHFQHSNCSEYILYSFVFRSIYEYIRRVYFWNGNIILKTTFGSVNRRLKTQVQF